MTTLRETSAKEPGDCGARNIAPRVFDHPARNDVPRSDKFYTFTEISKGGRVSQPRGWPSQRGLPRVEIDSTHRFRAERGERSEYLGQLVLPQNATRLTPAHQNPSNS